MKHGNKYDLRVFRLTSLWFDNTSLDDVSIAIRDNIGQISSHKFLPLMYQLAARMSSPPQPSVFQATLDALIGQLLTSLVSVVRKFCLCFVYKLDYAVFT